MDMAPGRWPTPVRWLAAAGVAGAAAGALLLAWGVLIEPRLVDRRRLEVRLPGLPDGWDGQQVALLADFQIGAPLSNVDTLDRMLRELAERRPAAVLLAGDYVYDLGTDPRPILDTLAGLLRPLTEAGVAVYAVLGNHDFATENTNRPRQQVAYAMAVSETLQTTGVHVLHNQTLRLRLPGAEPLYLVGLGEHTMRADPWPLAARDLPAGAPRIVLMHSPASFRPIPPGEAPLALAGHTHGGQIRAPLLPGINLARLFRPWPMYADGWLHPRYGQPGNHLYVNRGIGFSTLPIRIGTPPELTLITLRPAPPILPDQPQAAATPAR